MQDLRPDAPETAPCSKGIGFAGVGPPVVFFHAPFDVTHHTLSNNTIAGDRQNNPLTIHQTGFSHFYFWAV